MQNSSYNKNASLDNTRENQAMSTNVGEQSFVPASMVQNILEWQRQALETIREQNKANQVTQQQNNTLLRRIDTLQQYIHDYKQDQRNLDVMDLDDIKMETIGIAEEINQNLGENQLRGSSSNDALLIKDNDNPHVSTNLLRQSPEEIERRYKKALEDLDNEWRDKYIQLQTKYDVQYKAYQELKEHYQKRSVEWKRVKKWLDEQKFAQKNPERTDQVNELTSKTTKSKVQFEKSPTIIHERDSPFSNDSKTNSSGALADVTNMRNQISPSQNHENGANNEHVVDVNKALILGSSYNKDDDHIVFRQDNNRSSLPNLLLGSMTSNKTNKTQTNHCPDSNPIYCDQEWKEDRTALPNNSDHDMSNVNTEVHNSKDTEKNEKDNSKENELLEGTTPELAIDLEDKFLFDDENPSLKKKRTADTVTKQEKFENNELSSTKVTNKRYKPLTNKQKSKSREEFDEVYDEEYEEDFMSEDIITKTPYSNRFIVDPRRPQKSADNNDIESASPLTPITPASIKNKGVEKESNNKNNDSKQGEGFRFIETVRKKSERRQLMAQDCRDCRRYYEMTGISLSRQCDHNVETLVQDRKQLIGKHRIRYSRPQTPPGFWKVGFPTSQEIAEINELSVTYEREREEQKRKEMEFAKSRERRWDNGSK